MKTGRLAALGLVLILSFSTVSWAGEFSVSLASGVFFARQKTYREIYGSSIPLSLEAWYKFDRRFGVSIGLDVLQDKGTAKAFGEANDDYPLKFRQLTIPVTVFYELDSKTIDIRLGAGLCFHSYEEEWQDVSLGFKGSKIAPRLYAAADYPLLSKLKLFGSVAFDTIPAGEGSFLIGKVNLGGFRILGGLTVRVF